MRRSLSRRYAATSRVSIMSVGATGSGVSRERSLATSRFSHASRLRPEPGGARGRGTTIARMPAPRPDLVIERAVALLGDGALDESALCRRVALLARARGGAAAHLPREPFARPSTRRDGRRRARSDGGVVRRHGWRLG